MVNQTLRAEKQPAQKNKTRDAFSRATTSNHSSGPNQKISDTDQPDPDSGPSTNKLQIRQQQQSHPALPFSLQPQTYKKKATNKTAPPTRLALPSTTSDLQEKEPGASPSQPRP